MWSLALGLRDGDLRDQDPSWWRSPLAFIPPWGRGKRGEASQNLEPPRTGPSTPLLLGLGHYSLLNRAVCEETRGVNTVITWPELGKEWKHGILKLHVESFSHALCQRQRKLLCFWLLFYSQLLVRPPQTTILPFCTSFSGDGLDPCLFNNVMNLCPQFFRHSVYQI